MLNERFDDLSRKPDAKFLTPASTAAASARTSTMESLSATVPDGKIQEGLAAIAVEGKRAREFGFGADEMDRARKWMAAFYERAYTERDKTESGSFAQEYLNYFLEGEPTPGHRLRVRARAATAAWHHRGRSLDAAARDASDRREPGRSSPSRRRRKASACRRPTRRAPR